MEYELSRISSNVRVQVPERCAYPRTSAQGGPMARPWSGFLIQLDQISSVDPVASSSSSSAQVMKAYRNILVRDLSVAPVRTGLLLSPESRLNKGTEWS